MSDDVQRRLLQSVYACMRPLARLLIRSGITYKQFGEVAKKAFVHEALLETDDRGRRTNASRMAVRTGLSRKEIRRVIALKGPVYDLKLADLVDHSGPLARILHAWHSFPDFCGEDGQPIDVPFDDEGPSFTKLVKLVAGDVPAGAVRAELKRAGAIQELNGGRLRVKKRHFVPEAFDEKAITVLSGMLFPLTAGIEYNSSTRRGPEGFIQRFAFSDHLDPSDVPVFRRWSREQARAFAEAMNDWLAENETREVARDSKGHHIRAGVGVFYYEGPTAEDLIWDVADDGSPRRT